jgi:hypothetical protein
MTVSGGGSVRFQCHGSSSSPAEPMVRRLPAGGERIRTFSSARSRYSRQRRRVRSAVSGGSSSRRNSSIGLPRPTIARFTYTVRCHSIGERPVFADTDSPSSRASSFWRRPIRVRARLLRLFADKLVVLENDWQSEDQRAQRGPFTRLFSPVSTSGQARTAVRANRGIHSIGQRHQLTSRHQTRPQQRRTACISGE